MSLDAVLYSAEPTPFAQLPGWPTDEVAGADPVALPGYAVVRLTAAGTTVRTLSFPRP